jgi:hypothetical protein
MIPPVHGELMLAARSLKSGGIKSGIEINKDVVRRRRFRMPGVAWQHATSSLAPVSINRIITHVTSKRLNEHPIHPEIAWISKLLDTDAHAFVPSNGLCTIGP